MAIKPLRNLALLVFFFAATLNQVDAGEPQANFGLMGETALTGRVIEVNEEYRFVVINLGTVDGIKKGIVFSVFQKDEEVAKIKASRVRRHISACDIQMVYSGRGIGVGDVVIYKRVPPLVKMFKPIEPTVAIETEPIIVDIDAPKYTILSKSLSVFKESGVMITESDSSNYTFKAQKYVQLPLDISLLTDWGPVVQNKVYYTVEVTTTPRYNRLIIHLRGVYDREGQVYNHGIKKDSSVYQEVQNMAFMIKDLAEEL
jgi:hypothetical protein